MGIFATILGGNTQSQHAQDNRKMFRQGNDAQIAAYEPYTTAGTNGLKAYLDSIGLGDGAAGMAAFENSPAYQLNYNTAMDEGRRGVTDVAQATGTYNSGRTLKALQDRAQQTSRGFFSDYLKGLSGVADMGLGATGSREGLRQSYLDRITGANTDAANAKTSQYQGIDSLLAYNMESAAKFLGGGM